MTSLTEQQNSTSINIDQMNPDEILTLINSEDQKVPRAVNEAIPVITKFVDKVISCLEKGGSLFYIGSGTSGRLGVLDAVECVPTFSVPSTMVQGIIAGNKDAMFRSIEGAEDDKAAGERAVLEAGISDRDVILGIAASSTTPYVLAALKTAKQNGTFTGLLCCNEALQSDFVDVLIPIIVGPEVITGSTRMKSGTATKLVLNMITTTTMIKLNKTYGNLMVDLKACNQKLWERGTRLVAHFTDLPHNEAGELLRNCDGEVKTAIVVHKLKISQDEARKTLKDASGSLRSVIG